MSAKLIICCSGRPALNGHKRRLFQWNPEYNCFVYENRLFDEVEFNSKIEEVMKKNSDLRPYVKVAVLSDGSAVQAPAAPTGDYAALQAKYAALQARIGQPVTAAEAEEVLLRLAPHRLKAKPGRKLVAEPAPELAEV